MINGGIDWHVVFIAPITIIHCQFPGCTDFSFPPLSSPVTAIPLPIIAIKKPISPKFQISPN
jgi:hypothetical protein